MLARIADDIWTVEHDLFSMGLHFPGRMTVIRLSGGGLWLHSPVPIDDALARELDALGPVEHLVAPNRFHHLHVGPAKARYPTAKVWGAPGLDKKRKDLAFDAILEEAPPPDWQGDLQQIAFFAAPLISEVLFFHEASRTLVVTDMLMNVHECQGVLSRIVYWSEGVYRRLGVPRLNRLLTRDKAAASRAAGRLVALEPKVVILAHGRIVEQDTAAAVRDAFSVFRPTPALSPGDARA